MKRFISILISLVLCTTALFSQNYDDDEEYDDEYSDEEYDEEMTDEESELLSKQAERIEDKVNKLQQKWGCETDDD